LVEPESAGLGTVSLTPKSSQSSTPRPGPEAESKIRPDLTPQLIDRVHELHKQLRREEVDAVQGWEKAQREIKHEKPEPESHE